MFNLKLIILDTSPFRWIGVRRC